MNILNIKTKFNYYLYDINRKIVYGSNQNTYFVYQYFIETYEKYKFVTDKEIHYISEYLKVSLIEVKKSISRLNFLFKHINVDIKCIEVSSSTVNESDIIESLSNINQILIEVTEVCNFDCNYCCYGELYYNNSERKNCIDIEQCLSFIRDILNLKLEKRNHSVEKHMVISFYGGEPLLNFDAIKTIVEYVNQNYSIYISFSFSMTTNGYLLDKYMDFFISNNFSLSISLDGNSKQNAYRRLKNQTSSFNKVYENIKFIRNNYPEYYKNKIGFISVIHNLNNRISILKYFNSWSKSPLITQLTKDGVRSDKKDLFTQMYNQGEATSSEISSLQKTEPDIYKSITDRLYDLDNILYNYNSKSDIFTNQISLQNVKSGSCFLFQSRIFYTTQGILYPCEKVNRKFSFGIYKSNSFLFDIKAINDYYSYITHEQSTKCKDCAIKYDCDMCYFNAPNIYEKCENRMTFKQLTSMVTNIIEFHESKYIYK